MQKSGLNKTKKSRWPVMVAAMLSAVLVMVSIIWSGEASAQAQVQRLTGEDRIATAHTIALEQWKTAETVLLARYDLFPDALAGVPLAHFYGAPILLTYPDRLRDDTLETLRGLQAKKVILLGGEAAVSPQVEQSLRSVVQEVERIGGKDRYETAQLIAERLPNSGQQAIVVNGENFPDALAAGPYAARQGMPILLVAKNRIPEPTRQALAKISSLYVVGGPNVVSDQITEQLRQIVGMPVQRLAGDDRYGTAVELVRYFKPPMQTVVVATGENFADALSGAALAAKLDAPILLVRSAVVPVSVSQLLRNVSVERYVILGGTAAVSGKVEAELKGWKPLRIMIDPGHGGSDPGAMGNGLKEKDLTLDIAKRVTQHLSNRYLDVHVRMTRETDVYLTLNERTQMANQWPADFFLSIHINAAADPAANGFESYVYNKPGCCATSLAKQQVIHPYIVQQMKFKDRGMKRANFHVLRETTMPSILLENLYISNPGDAAKLANPQFREQLARAIADGVAKAWGIPPK